MISEGLIDADAAVARLHPSALLRLSDPVLDPDAPRDLIGRGVAASPGAAVGRIALTPTGAEEMAAGGNDVILVRPSTSPDDVAGMIAARGIVTAHGGRTSHAAVVARGMDRPAVCGVDGLEVTRVEARFASATLRDGDEISIDGSTGEVYRGAVPRVARDLDPRLGELLAYCDANRRVRCLSEGGPARWADGAFDGNGATVCRSDDDLAGAAGGAALVVDPSDVEGARGLIASAADAAARGATVFVRVDRSWPRDVSRLPAAPWAGITATEAGATAARLLAATVDPAT
jgi:pyruvate,orthophosphate dikinase